MTAYARSRQGCYKSHSNRVVIKFIILPDVTVFT